VFVCVCVCVCVRVCTYTGSDEEEIPEHVKEAMRHSAPTSLPQSISVLLPKGRGTLKSPASSGKQTQTQTDKLAASPLRGTCVQVQCMCVCMVRPWGSGVCGCGCVGAHVLAPIVRLLVRLNDSSRVLTPTCSHHVVLAQASKRNGGSSR
jgi:hypothetical protein